MCGITGALALGSQPTDRAILEQMTQALFHRGPDGFGIAQHGRVGLGHRRLRILDLSTDADQPMWNDARDVAIVFNGEMYNFREIRRELEAKGVRFRTSSDTEVVLALYEREGENAIRRLDGMFALAVWDGRKRRLVLARDRAGQKPLFYYDDGERFLFASEIQSASSPPGRLEAAEPGSTPALSHLWLFPVPAHRV